MKTALVASHILVALTLLGCSAPDTSGVFRNNGRSIGHDFQTGGSGSGGSDGQGGATSSSDSTSSTTTSGSGGGGAAGCECPEMLNSVYTCPAGQCEWQSCQPGYADCDGNHANGCEANELADASCGSSCTVCGNGTKCQSSPEPDMNACYCPGAPQPNVADEHCLDTVLDVFCCSELLNCQSDKTCAQHFNTWATDQSEFGDASWGPVWMALRTCKTNAPNGGICGN